MRTALMAASMALVAGMTVGCGESGPPTDASAEEFCGVFDQFDEDVEAEMMEAMGEGEEMDPEAGMDQALQSVKDLADNLEEVGTPEDIPDDAREGFELVIDTIQDIEGDITAEQLAEIDSEFTDEEREASDAFDEYLSETCEDSSGEGEEQ